jgi:hypothetical protein
MTDTYAGIGSRPKPGQPIPAAVTTLAAGLASALEALGYTLRSGAAKGMDAAFESGVAGNAKEIYLPWPKFNHHPSLLDLDHVSPQLWKELWNFAKSYHPAWYHVTPRVALLLMRNSQQILGFDLKSPAKFVLCWTHDGKDSGGTGQAIRVARRNGVPVFNLRDLADMSLLHRTQPWSRDAIDNYLACVQS